MLIKTYREVKITYFYFLSSSCFLSELWSELNQNQFEEVLKEKKIMSTIERLEREREQTIAKTRAEGVAEGRTEGRAEGISEGEERKEMENIKSLMETLSLSAKEAMKALKIPASKQKKYVAML